jgi:hypothetical protein
VSPQKALDSPARKVVRTTRLAETATSSFDILKRGALP